jgi:integrase
MTRAWNRLTANFVRGATERGRYADGGGLYLQVAQGGTGAWVFLFTRNGTSRAMGLGSTRTVSLALARELAGKARETLARGLDPIDARRADVLAQAARAKLTTFKQAAEEFFETNKTRWTNQKHRDEWISAMRRLAYPALGNVTVDTIEPDNVCQAVAPLLADKHVTAARLRGRIEVVMHYAIAKKYRTGANPATKAVIRQLLPLRAEKDGVTHQPAVPYEKLPTVVETLRTTAGIEARLLEMVVLSVMRLTAVRWARFDEIDHAEKVWTIPAGKPGMKGLGKDHQVPLTDRMVEIIKDLRQAHPEGPYVFGGRRPIREESPRLLLADVLKSIGHDHAVPHGFRSSLKTWATETRTYSTDVVEMALAHKIKSDVELAYQRGALLAKRRVLMADWERHCYGVGPASGEIIKLRA